MMSRIDCSIDFSDMPDRRGKSGAYKSIKVTPHSVAAILPATLAHGTNETASHVPNGSMQGCGEAFPTENQRNELSQFLKMAQNQKRLTIKTFRQKRRELHDRQGSESANCP